MKRRSTQPKTRTRRVTADNWERAWQEHWSKVGTPGYELPPGEEREFLENARTPAKEREWLKRIDAEFARAFRALYPAGPAVTVFGSVRTPDQR